MRHLYKILILSILVLSNHVSFGQVEIDNEIIADLIKSEIHQFPNDTIFNRKGQIKRIHTFGKLEIVLLIETETYLFDPKVDSLEMFNKNGLSTLNLDCYSDFCEKNRSKVVIDSIGNFNGSISYLTKNEMINLFKQGGWVNYHKAFGNIPLIKISRPGISTDKNKAFIYYSESFDGLAGAGFYVILEKINNNWRVKEKMQRWRS